MCWRHSFVLSGGENKNIIFHWTTLRRMLEWIFVITVRGWIWLIWKKREKKIDPGPDTSESNRGERVCSLSRSNFSTTPTQPGFIHYAVEYKKISIYQTEKDRLTCFSRDYMSGKRKKERNPIGIWNSSKMKGISVVSNFLQISR